MKSPCLVCGQPSDASRCPEHQFRVPDTRDPQARGYDGHWKRLSRKARRLQPFCSDCSATEGLQGDHTPEAWRRRAAGLPVRLKDIDVVCGPCNRARGNARDGSNRAAGEDPRREDQRLATRGVGVDGPAFPPKGKAETPLHTTKGM